MLPSNDLGFEIVCQIESSGEEDNQFRHILGSRNGINDNDYAFMADSWDNYYFRFEYGGIEGDNAISTNISSLQKQKIIFKNRTLYINSVNCGTVPNFNFTSNKSIYVFTINSNNTAELRNLKLKLYGLKFYRSNEVIREYVPCYRKTDNKPGLYDLANNEFYTNSGTGYDFEIPFSLPSGYRQVEYLESTGVQYIDTLYVPSGDIGFEMDCKIEKSQHEQRYRHLFGSRNSAGDNDFALMVDTNTSNYTFRFEYGGINGNKVLLPDLNALQRNRIEFKDRRLTINSVSYGTVPYFNFNSNKNIYLFSLNNNNNAELRNLDMKLYRFKLYSDGRIVRDFIPCYRITDTKPGLYDIVNNQFYTNSSGSSIDFTIGPNI